jgi:hypothetical protein
VDDRERAVNVVGHNQRHIQYIEATPELVVLLAAEFASVRRETREECARVCEAKAETYDTCSHESSQWACGECAAAIRALSGASHEKEE